MKRMLLVLIAAVVAVPARQLVAAQAASPPPAPPDFVSEVIQIKYASAPGLAATLNGCATGGHAVPASLLKERLMRTLGPGNLDGEIQALGRRRIISDELANLLLVKASPSDLARVKALIAKLDVALPEVWVEAVIFELPLHRSKSLPRFAAQPGRQADPFLALGALTGFNVNPVARFLSRDIDSGLGRTETEFTRVGTLSGGLDGAVSALATNNEVRLLQRPRIMTTEAVPVRLFVGPGPRPPVYDYGPSSLRTGYDFIQSLQAGVMLNTTCLLPTNGLILMDIHRDATTITGSVAVPNVGKVPVTTTRKSQAHVAVRDGETIVLAGFVQMVRIPVFSKVALLDRVPRVGAFLNRLITYPTHETPHGLLVLIRPTVVPIAQTTAWRAKAQRAKMPPLGPVEEELHAEALKRLHAAEVNLKP